MHKAVVVVLPLASLFLVPFLFSNDDFFLNQFFIQRKMIEKGTASSQVYLDFVYSKYLFGVNNLLRQGQTDSINFDDPSSVFDYVFSRIPASAIVYPTETYYYYSFVSSGQKISGNMRLLDADDGVIHIGYFDVNEPRNSRAASFDDTNGVIVQKIKPDVARAHFNGKTIDFQLNEIWKNKPTRIQLFDFEEFVAQIQDESSLRFFLLFNNETRSFYYVLNDEAGIEDSLKPISPNYLKGVDSGFVFYEDPTNKRKILVGVYRQNIYANNYYDGPFDQVPPRLGIKDKVLTAYPYTAYAGGIDEHGNFLGFEGTRIAISPYYDYESIDDLLQYHMRCFDAQTNKSHLWSCLTYEWKKDFHKQLEQQGQDPAHFVFLSQGWPANHYGNNSMVWQADHTRQSSSTWPPNHLFALSSE